MSEEKVDLQAIWKQRIELLAKCNRLLAESEKLFGEGDKIYTKGDRLYAKANKLMDANNTLWHDALNACGAVNVSLKNWNKKYSSFEYHLSSGEVFGFPEP